MNPHDVRLYTTDTIPHLNRRIIWSQAFFAVGSDLRKSLDNLRDLAAKADCAAVVALRVEFTSQNYGALGTTFTYLAYGTGLEFAE